MLIRLLSLGLFAAGPEWAYAQLEIPAPGEPQRVFGGDLRNIAVTFRDSGGRGYVGDLSIRLYQTTSATAAPVVEQPWKRIQIFPGQTVLESANINFPAVRAETPFLIQWIEGTNRVIGKTEVLVYPTNLLQELEELAGDQDDALGLFDPSNQLKPLLKNLKVDFVDLEIAGVETFRGKLAIVGPFPSKTQMREGLAKQVQIIARKGVAVVWIQPPPEPRDALKPSFYTVPEGRTAVVVVQAGMVSNLPENPQSQLNLPHFARLALRPEPARLPHLTPDFSYMLHEPKLSPCHEAA